MRTLAIVNQKGGCGKTTTAINLGAVLAHRGDRVLLVDIDPQSHCAAGLGVPDSSIEYAIDDALLTAPDRIDFERLLWPIGRRLHLAPSTMRLAAVEAPGGGMHALADKDRRLAGVIERVASEYDWVLIDCPPTVGLLTFNALRAAREALIPVETGYFALKGAQKQWETIQRVIERIGRPIACHLLPTLYDETSDLARDILGAMRRQFAGQIVPISIRMRDDLRVAASLGRGIVEHAPGSEAHDDFAALADWLTAHGPRPAVVSSGAVEIGVFRRDPPPLPGRAGELAARLRPVPVEPAPPSPRPGTADLVACAEELDAQQALIREALRAEPEAIPADAPPEPTPSFDAPSEGTPSPVRAFEAPAGPSRYGVQVAAGLVRFTQPAQGVGSIAVAGTFNGWMPAALERDGAAGVFCAAVSLPPGQHRYRLVVDGAWLADPYNEHFDRNEHGEMNSVVTVPATAASASTPSAAPLPIPVIAAPVRVPTYPRAPSALPAPEPVL